MIKYKRTFIISLVLLLALSTFRTESQVRKPSSGYFLVLATKLNVREKPDIKSTIIIQKNFASLVQLLKRSGKFEIIDGNKTEWVYIDTSSFDKSGKNTIKGWVVDYYLSNLSEFKPAISFGDYYYEVLMTHDYIRINFYPDSTYNTIYSDRVKNIEYELKGRLYQFRNIIVAQDEKSRLLMYIDEKGNIVTEFNHILQKGHKTFKLNEPAGPDVLRPDMWCTPDKKKKEQ